MHTAPDLLFGESGEPALDQVEPTGRSGREVQMEARALGQPVANQLGFMGAVVVQNQMHLQLCRHVVLDSVEEEPELPGAMTAVRLADERLAPSSCNHRVLTTPRARRRMRNELFDYRSNHKLLQALRLLQSRRDMLQQAERPQLGL